MSITPNAEPMLEHDYAAMIAEVELYVGSACFEDEMANLASQRPHAVFAALRIARVCTAPTYEEREAVCKAYERTPSKELVEVNDYGRRSASQALAVIASIAAAGTERGTEGKR